MSAPVISGDAVFSHVFLGAADMQKSVAFYDAALGALGIIQIARSPGGVDMEAHPHLLPHRGAEPAEGSTELDVVA